MFDVIKFFTPSYLFDLRPAVSDLALIEMAVIFGGLILLAIALVINSRFKTYEKALTRTIELVVAWASTMGVMGLLLVFARYEQAYFISGRFWLLVWTLLALVWLGIIVRHYFRLVPKAHTQHLRYEEFHKYLPKKRRK